MVNIVHIIAGCHCPPIRKIHEILINSTDNSFYLPNVSSLQDVLLGKVENESVNARGDHSSAKVYASFAPTLFSRRHEILHQGLFYGNAPTAAASLSETLKNAFLNIHFLIEPAMSHLNRHFNSQSASAREQLERGYTPPGWVYPFLSVSDAITSGSVYAWNLQSIESWREEFIVMISDGKANTSKIDLLNYHPHPENLFKFDQRRDQARFELELDAIDSLPELILKE